MWWKTRVDWTSLSDNFLTFLRKVEMQISRRNSNNEDTSQLEHYGNVHSKYGVESWSERPGKVPNLKESWPQLVE